jgi:uncharacterized membrane protein
MPAITVQQHIHAPVEDVFAHCIDLEHLPERVRGIDKVEVLTEGPVADGTTFRETRTMFGREATEEMTFADFDPPNGYTLLAESHGTRYRTTHTFETVDGGTLVTMHFEARARSLTAKLMTPMYAMMKGKLEQCLLDDLQDLKNNLEGAPEPGPDDGAEPV